MPGRPSAGRSRPTAARSRLRSASAGGATATRSRPRTSAILGFGPRARDGRARSPIYCLNRGERAISTRERRRRERWESRRPARAPYSCGSSSRSPGSHRSAPLRRSSPSTGMPAMAPRARRAFVRGERFAWERPLRPRGADPQLSDRPAQESRNIGIGRTWRSSGSRPTRAKAKQNAVAAFQAGRSDWVDDFPRRRRIVGVGGRSSGRAPTSPPISFASTPPKPPSTTDAWREAFHCAIDRAAICERVLRLGQRPATHLVPASIEGACGYRPVEGALFDPARARALLAEAGHADGRGLGPVQYQVDTNEDNRRIAEAIQAMLRRILGSRWSW